jgi:hypothetical protein
MLVHWLLFSGVSYCDNRECVFMFDYDTKEKEHQKHSAIWFILGDNSPSYKSDSLRFRCSFYYLLLRRDVYKMISHHYRNIFHFNDL